MSLVIAARGDAAVRRPVRWSRAFIVLAGVVLCLAAQLAAELSGNFRFLLDMMFTLGGMVGGALFAGFLLAFCRLPIDGRGYAFAAPLSVLTIFAIALNGSFRDPGQRAIAQAALCVLAGVLLAAWLGWLAARGRDAGGAERAKTLPLAAALAGVVWIGFNGYWTDPSRPGVRLTIAWPYFTPIGSAVAFGFGWLLAGRRAAGTGPSELEEAPAMLAGIR
jgi:hypothetical protein